MSPTAADVGSVVRISDGRTGVLLRVEGKQADVLMPGERWVRCALNKLEVVP